MNSHPLRLSSMLHSTRLYSVLQLLQAADFLTSCKQSSKLRDAEDPDLPGFQVEHTSLAKPAASTEAAGLEESRAVSPEP